MLKAPPQEDYRNEDDISNIMLNITGHHQQSIQDHSESNLLDSNDYTHPLQALHSIPLSESESEEEEDFLKKVDGILEDSQGGRSTRR